MEVPRLRNEHDLLVHNDVALLKRCPPGEILPGFDFLLLELLSWARGLYGNLLGSTLVYTN